MRIFQRRQSQKHNNIALKANEFVSRLAEKAIVLTISVSRLKNSL